MYTLHGPLMLSRVNPPESVHPKKGVNPHFYTTGPYTRSGNKLKVWVNTFFRVQTPWEGYLHQRGFHQTTSVVDVVHSINQFKM